MLRRVWQVVSRMVSRVLQHAVHLDQPIRYAVHDVAVLILDLLVILAQLLVHEGVRVTHRRVGRAHVILKLPIFIRVLLLCVVTLGAQLLALGQELILHCQAGV